MAAIFFSYPIASLSPKVVKLETFPFKNGGVIRIRGAIAPSTAPQNRKLATCSSVSASGDGNSSVETDVPFPTDYSELLEQVSLSFASIIWLILTFSFDIDLMDKCSAGLIMSLLISVTVS